MSDFSISIISILDGEKEIERFLEKFFEDNIYPPYELIIIVNNCVDQAIEVASRYATRIFIRIVKNDQYNCLFNSIKAGIEMANCQYIFLSINTNFCDAKALNISADKLLKTSIDIVGIISTKIQAKSSNRQSIEPNIINCGYLCRKEIIAKFIDTQESQKNIFSLDEFLSSVLHKIKADMLCLNYNDDQGNLWEEMEWPSIKPLYLNEISRNIHEAQKDKIIVYTCNFGKYEKVKEPLNIDTSVKYILFTDDKNLESDHWEIVYLADELDNPRRTSRIPKLLPHMYLPQHDISVYIDSSIEIKESDIRNMVKVCLEDMDIALYRHYKRNCVYDEINFCKKNIDRNVDDKLCDYHISKYNDINYPRNAGLFENAFIIRKNNDIINKLNEKWWEEYSLGADRDQFSLAYCLWLLCIAPNAIKIGKQFRINPYVNFHKHKYIQY